MYVEARSNFTLKYILKFFIINVNFDFRVHLLCIMDDKEVPTFKVFKFNKNTEFQTGDGICGKCKGKIFAAEKVWGPGEDNPWHKDCLKCLSCRKKLEPGSFQEDDGDPYCTACFNKKNVPLGLL